MMKSIMATYPDFKGLPRGVKQMLLTSENFFFDEVKIASTGIGDGMQGFVVFNLPGENSRSDSSWRN